MPSVFVSNLSHEQLLRLLKMVGSRTKTSVTDEQLVGCMQTATKKIKTDNDSYSR